MFDICTDISTLNLTSLGCLAKTTYFPAQCYILGQWLPKTAAFDAVFDPRLHRVGHVIECHLFWRLAFFYPSQISRSPKRAPLRLGIGKLLIACPVLAGEPRRPELARAGVSCRFLPGVIPRLRHPAMILAIFID